MKNYLSVDAVRPSQQAILTPQKRRIHESRIRCCMCTVGAWLCHRLLRNIEPADGPNLPGFNPESASGMSESDSRPDVKLMELKQSGSENDLMISPEEPALAIVDADADASGSEMQEETTVTVLGDDPTGDDDTPSGNTGADEPEPSPVENECARPIVTAAAVGPMAVVGGVGPASPDGDAMRCSTRGQCNIPNDCTPRCNYNTCGDDGCGGSCGECVGGASCQGVTGRRAGAWTDMCVAADYEDDAASDVSAQHRTNGQRRWRCRSTCCPFDLR